MPSLFKRIFLKKEGEGKQNEPTKQNLIKGIVARGKNLFAFTIKNLKNTIATFRTTKLKLLDLSETNYKVGLLHFNNGNLWDATFRFKFIDKFWPDYKNEKYYLAYCLALRGSVEEAKLILDEFLKKNQRDKEAKNLLDVLNSGNIENLKKRYQESFEKNFQSKLAK